MIRVLFVCLGNICRSPTAEGIFRHRVAAAGLDGQIATDSCGTSGWHIGNPPDPRAVAEAARRGIRIDDLRGRATAIEDFSRFDYILAMDRRNLADLRAMCPPGAAHRLHLFLNFAPEVGRDEVPDPYTGGAEHFRSVFDMISAGADGLLTHITAHDLR